MAENQARKLMKQPSDNIPQVSFEHIYVLTDSNIAIIYTFLKMQLLNNLAPGSVEWERNG